MIFWMGTEAGGFLTISILMLCSASVFSRMMGDVNVDAVVAPTPAAELIPPVDNVGVKPAGEGTIEDEDEVKEEEEEERDDAVDAVDDE